MFKTIFPAQQKVDSAEVLLMKASVTDPAAKGCPGRNTCLHPRKTDACALSSVSKERTARGPANKSLERLFELPVITS